MQLSMASSPAGTLKSHVANQQQPKKVSILHLEFCPKVDVYIQTAEQDGLSVCAPLLYLFQKGSSFTY